MLKKTITYEDWNGTERTEDFYFNLTRVEVMELEYGIGDSTSLTESISRIVKSQDMGTIIRTIKEIILKAYGQKSSDGLRFVKNDEIREAFEQNPAFDILYMEMATNPEYAAEFITGIMPASLRENLGSDPSKKLLNRMNEFEKTAKLS